MNTLVTRDVLDIIEKKLLSFEQHPIDTVHRFADGIYIREVHVPADTVAVGRYHKTAHLNNLIKGRVLILNEDASTTELVAPLTYVSQPGQKVGRFVEDTIWQTIHATTETDVEKLEELLLEPNQNLIDAQKALEVDHSDDISDYQLILQERGMTEEQVKAIVENELDRVPAVEETESWIISDSPIQGKGIFATKGFIMGEVIGVGRVVLNRTPLGRYTNHSKHPNAEAFLAPDGNVYMRAIKPIVGARGGLKGDEITLNYRQVTVEALKADKENQLCHHL